MGLDMYLNGRKYLFTNWHKPETHPKEDGYDIKEKTLSLGYWRKHPDLHGFIVNTFASGEDECQDIDLSAEQLQQIIQAVKDKSLPKTEGFFFGASDGSEDQETIETLEKAVAWIAAREKYESRDVIYRASW
jgi:hypothetical protein